MESLVVQEAKIQLLQEGAKTVTTLKVPRGVLTTTAPLATAVLSVSTQMHTLSRYGRLPCFHLSTFGSNLLAILKHMCTVLSFASCYTEKTSRFCYLRFQTYDRLLSEVLSYGSMNYIHKNAMPLVTLSDIYVCSFSRKK